MPDSQARISKLHAVSGDVGEPDFGLSASDLVLVRSTVSLLYHCAATVKFHEHLLDAWRINVEGAVNAAKLAASFHAVHPILVHVSTAYVAGKHQVLLAPKD